MLAKLAALVLAAPRRVLATATLLCVLLGAPAVTAPLDMSFLSVVDRDVPLIARYLAMNENVGLSQRTVLLLEGSDDAVQAAASRAVETLRASEHVDWVFTDPRHPAGSRVVLAALTSDPMTLAARDIARGEAAFSVVEDAVADALADSGVSIGWTGVPAQTIQDIEATLGRFMWLSPLSLLIVLALLRVVEPRLSRLALIGTPMVLAVMATLGVSALVFGNISFNEGFFGIIVCGLGADFALHLLVRLREERASAAFPEALTRTMRGAGGAIAAGAATTIGAFTVLSLAPETMPHRMGVTGAVGLLLCLGLMLTWLPAAWLLLDAEGDAPATLTVPGVAWLASRSVRRPAVVLGLTAVLLAGSLAGLGRLRYETDFNRIVNRDVPAGAVAERLQQLFGGNAAPWVVASDTLAEARVIATALAADPGIVRVEGAATVLPPGIDRLPPGLPEGVVAQLRGRDGRWLTWVYTGYAGLDTVRLAEDRRRIEAIAPDAAGYGMFIEAVVAGDHPWARWVALGILLLVVAVLLIDLRSPRWAVVALLPAVVGMTVTVGALCWLDIGFGVVHVVSVPLLLGLGVDDGLHVVHRLRDDPTLPADLATTSVGRAIVMTTATTCASFAAILLSNNPSLESMALVILIGLPMCLLASISLVPAAAAVLRLRPGPPVARNS